MPGNVRKWNKLIIILGVWVNSNTSTQKNTSKHAAHSRRGRNDRRKNEKKNIVGIHNHTFGSNTNNGAKNRKTHTFTSFVVFHSPVSKASGLDATAYWCYAACKNAFQTRSVSAFFFFFYTHYLCSFLFVFLRLCAQIVFFFRLFFSFVSLSTSHIDYIVAMCL